MRSTKERIAPQTGSLQLVGLLGRFLRLFSRLLLLGLALSLRRFLRSIQGDLLVILLPPAARRHAHTIAEFDQQHPLGCPGAGRKEGDKRYAVWIYLVFTAKRTSDFMELITSKGGEVATCIARPSTRPQACNIASPHAL